MIWTKTYISDTVIDTCTDTLCVEIADLQMLAFLSYVWIVETLHLPQFSLHLYSQ
jgi:hypothetical protein